MRKTVLPVLVQLVWLLPVECLSPCRGEEPVHSPYPAADSDPELIKRVVVALEKGRGWVWRQQNEDGEFWDYSTRDRDNVRARTQALCVLTMLVSGLPRTDSSVQKGFQALRKMLINDTETAAWALMALEARWGNFLPEKRIRGEYGAKEAGAPLPVAAEDREWAKDLLAAMCEGAAEKGQWNRTRNQSAVPDHFHGAMAALGLRSYWAINRTTFPEVLREMIEHLVAAQEQGGPGLRAWTMGEDLKDAHVVFRPSRRLDAARGWCFSASAVPKGEGGFEGCVSGCMTGAGVASLASCIEVLAMNRTPLPAEKRVKADRGLHDGLAWLSQNWSTRANPGGESGRYECDDVFLHLYLMMSAAQTTCSRNIGANDWYRDGACSLLDKQQAVGCWGEKTGDMRATCLALLFLSKATLPARIPMR